MQGEATTAVACVLRLAWKHWARQSYCLLAYDSGNWKQGGEGWREEDGMLAAWIIFSWLLDGDLTWGGTSSPVM